MVYIVTNTYHYEGTQILGIYYKLENAQERMRSFAESLTSEWTKPNRFEDTSIHFYSQTIEIEKWEITDA